MPTDERDGRLSPFPRLPGALRRSFADAALGLHPFGRDAADLEVDFEGRARPLLVTEILLRCARDSAGRAPAPEFLWGLPVGTRIECLLSVAAEGGRAAAVVPLRCAGSSCAQEFEVELTLGELSALQERHGEEERFRVRRGTRELWVRRPTGCDQLGWLERSFADAREAAAAMAATLTAGEAPAGHGESHAPSACARPAESSGPARLEEGWAEALDAALDEFDPLVNFSLLVRCPECGAESEHEVDLEELALASLRRAQQRLLTTVHLLASRYHWDERQIFSVPHWRRAHYLALIERENRR